MKPSDDQRVGMILINSQVLISSDDFPSIDLPEYSIDLDSRNEKTVWDLFRLTG